MGPGQQTISGDVEKLARSSPGRDFLSMDKRKLVTGALCVSFLTLVIVSYYMYFETPATSTEAMVFLQEKPFPNSLEVQQKLAQKLMHW